MDDSLIRRSDAIDALKKDVENLDKELMLYTLAPSQYTDNFKSCTESRIDGLNDALIDIESLPSAEPKTDGVLEQVRWERDCALKTLEDHGIGFAEKPRTGEWIEVEVLPEVYDIEGVKTWGSKMQCDQCGFRFTAIEGHITQYNFCPYCGADMRSKLRKTTDTDGYADQSGLASAT